MDNIVFNNKISNKNILKHVEKCTYLGCEIASVVKETTLRIGKYRAPLNLLI